MCGSSRRRAAVGFAITAALLVGTAAGLAPDASVPDGAGHADPAESAQDAGRRDDANPDPATVTARDASSPGDAAGPSLTDRSAPDAGPPPAGPSANQGREPPPARATAPSRVRGRACEVADLSRPAACVPVRSGGDLTVQLGDTRATLARDGSFDLPVPPGALPDTELLVTATGSTTFYGAATRVVLDANRNASGVALRLVSWKTLDAALATSRAPLAPTNGILVVRVTDRRAPAAGAQLTPFGGVRPAADSDDPRRFVPGSGTGPRGVAVYFDAQPGDGQVIATAGARGALVPVRVRTGSISFEALELASAAMLPTSPATRDRPASMR